MTAMPGSSSIISGTSTISPGSVFIFFTEITAEDNFFTVTVHVLVKPFPKDAVICAVPE